jgi:regulation of enolase protein 1 (concanavalin A-like superfamily)
VSIAFAGLPFALASDGPARAARPVAVEGGWTVAAAARSDLFRHPGGEGPAPDAERWLAPVTGDFRLRALVRPDFRATYDAGALLCYADDGNWLKVCAELDADGIARVVSVVTRDGSSDDANAWAMPSPRVYLRIARLGRTFALHSSSDGARWDLVRHFGMPWAAGAPVGVGLLAQSPTGEGTTVTFTDAEYTQEPLADLRDGT